MWHKQKDLNSEFRGEKSHNCEMQIQNCDEKHRNCEIWTLKEFRVYEKKKKAEFFSEL